MLTISRYKEYSLIDWEITNCPNPACKADLGWLTDKPLVCLFCEQPLPDAIAMATNTAVRLLYYKAEEA